MYPLKLKGISICFSMLKAALCGSYVNFGVFRLYGDEALDNALNIFVKLLLSIPQSDLLVRHNALNALYLSRFLNYPDRIKQIVRTNQSKKFLEFLSPSLRHQIKNSLNFIGCAQEFKIATKCCYSFY